VGLGQDALRGVEERVSTPTGRRLRRAGVVLVVGALVSVGIALAQPGVRARVAAHWHAAHLSSRDPMVRTQARLALLDIGRPAIDGVYPELIASEIADELTGTKDTVAFVARCNGPTETSWPNLIQLGLEVEATLSEAGPRTSGGRIAVFSAPGWPSIVCPVAQRLIPHEVSRVLVVARKQEWLGSHSGPPTEDVLELHVLIPLDDDLAPAVLEAVRERLKR
jgi:hypothetical protein